MNAGAVLRVAVAACVLAAAVGGWLARCTGPSPDVGAITVQAPASDGDPYTVFVTLHNDGRGHGSVQVSVRLIADSGEQFSGESSAELGGHESLTIPVQVPAPPAHYRAEASAAFPPP